MLPCDFFDRAIDDATFTEEKRAVGETPESRIRGIESLKKKLLQIEDLRPRLDDEFLLRFLRIAKFDVKKATERIRKYYSVRRTYNHLFKYFYPTSPKTALIKDHFLACPRRTVDHSVVLIYNRGMFDPTKMIYEEAFLMDSLVLDFVSENPCTQVFGVHIIVDFAGYGFQQFFEDTPGRIRMVIDTLQNSLPVKYKTIHIVNAPQLFSFLYNLCYPFLTAKIRQRNSLPVKYKAIHIVNAPQLFSFLYNLCYPFLTAKIRQRLILHRDNDWKSLHSIIQPELLPVEYGGTVPKTDLIDLADEIIKKDAQFKEQLQYGFVEKT